MKVCTLIFLLAAAPPLYSQVQLNQKENRVDISIGGQPYTALFFGPDTLKPFLHPLRTSDGTIVTRRWPMETVAGESSDHPHHQGVWFDHGNVNNFDFWENAKQEGNDGKIRLDRISDLRNGKTSGSLVLEATWIAPGDKALLTERRTITFHDLGANRAVDFDITLTALEEAVKFGDTKEGLLGIRIADAITEVKKGGMMVNASGAKGMKAVWGKPSPWVDYSGMLEGKGAGIAVFDHPGNPKHPTYWHSRDYGLLAANPFGEHDFFDDKARDGGLSVAPGKSLRFRYRIFVHPGDATSAKIADAYDTYAKAK